MMRVELHAAVVVVVLAAVSCSKDEPTAPCGGASECAEGQLCDAGTCRAPLTCAETPCATQQLCEEPPGEDGRCLEDCELGYTWTGSTCQPSTCVDLDCPNTQHRECVETPAPHCAGCEIGYVEDGPDLPCRLPLSCDDISCDSAEVCVERTLTADALCSVDGCPPTAVGHNGICYACPPCDDSARGEDGPYLGSLTGENKCICQTLPGYFWREGGFPGVAPCDADNDGWVRESAKIAIEAPPGSAIQVNARCGLRTIGSFTLHNEAGETMVLGLGQPLQLYETVRNDDVVELAESMDTPAYGPGGRKLQPEELNSLTKLCVESQADYNHNGLADVDEWHGNGNTSSINPTFLPFKDFTYFVELHRSWYDPADMSYHIAEKPRLAGAADGSIELTVNEADEGSYWRACTVWRDPLFTDPTYTGPHNGLDFARAGPAPSGWSGMNHHSQFKCVRVVAEEDPTHPPHWLTARQLNDQRYEANQCVAVGVPRGAVSGVAPRNPADPVLTCGRQPIADLVQGDVRFAVARYRDYESAGGYARGCVNECVEFPQRCPGWDPDPLLNASQCDGDPHDFGKLFCGCGTSFGGSNCEIACPGNPHSPVAGSSTSHVYIDPAFRLSPRTGYWLCANPSASTPADPAQPTTLSGSGASGTYDLAGGIVTSPARVACDEPGGVCDFSALCENSTDCSSGYALR